MDPLEPFDSIIQNSQIYDESALVVAKHLYSYYAELNKLEKTHSKSIRQNSIEDLQEAIAELTSVFEKYWYPKDDCWKPCSIGSEEEYCPTSIKNFNVMFDGQGEYIAYFEYCNEGAVLANGNRAYLVKNIESKPQIINKFY